MRVIEHFKDIPPSVQGVLMAVVIAILRVVYDQKETSIVRIILEGALCGSLAMTASTAIEALGYDQNWVIFFGGMIGFIGSTTIRAIAIKMIGQKVMKG
ncbi:phage holin, lambda family [Marinobacterium litorale]|uniref:phage holin, lambda family n=1 Tax=Marinobacterium litorale TaxID=404770 RepID=UPI00040148F1|nr:phage holin, lambda family [Marinobacterium litorale]